MSKLETTPDAEQSGLGDAAEYERRIDAARSLMRDHNFDGLIVSDDDLTLGFSFGEAQRQPPYARYLAGFNIPSGLHPHATVVIVPLSGEPVLLVPPGIDRSFTHLARRRSWMPNVIDTYVEDDPEWDLQTRWGLLANRLGVKTAETIEALGLERGRIGVVGRWASHLADIDDVRSRLPHAQLEPTLVPNESGGVRDLFEPLVSSNSAWEVDKLERAHVAANAIKSAFREAARGGASVREARVEALMAGARAGADDIVLFGSIGAEPWTYWDWSLPFDDHFREGRAYFIQCAISSVAGYETQTARSFVVGTPNKAQLHLIDTAQRALETIYAAAEVGMTGQQLYARGFEQVERAGLGLWAQLGHGMGYKFHAGPRGPALVHDNTNALTDRQALAIHACVVDKANGHRVMIGDTVLIDGPDGVRFLTDRLPYQLTAE